ncbi:hypothetical protein Mal15_19630 [Stieleria maiorica]|uniref:DUF1579 domain-containing protein n=1 Tax=Stieleria maiorica TaxID=2795974 RepID=A0A5B9MFM1_9BACT|nr:hypothetical protein [Stieleria maiorica]QEF97917.1 hypothetical protein Mal15_19630 [Stieleria maiorica]
MKTLFITMAFTLLCLTTMIDAGETTLNKIIHTIAGKWRPVESCQHLLDSELVSRHQTGFEISIDKSLGDSHRKTSGSGTYYKAWATALHDSGHELIATGHLRFDDGSEIDHLISRSKGSLYLTYGVVTGGSTRIFLGRGPNEESLEAIVVEWTQHSIGTPIDLERDFATVMYERVNLPAAPHR